MTLPKWQQELPGEKIVTTAEAVAAINNGCRVFLGTGCGEPQHLIHAMVANSAIQDVMIYQMFSHTLAQYVDDPAFSKRFSLKLFFISEPMRKAAFEGKIDYLPMYLSQIPQLFASRRIGLDVAMIQVSPPDHFGYCSLGVSVDITRSAVENSRLVIAQVNPGMPRTWGDSLVHVDNIDYFVPHEETLVNYDVELRDDHVTSRIGHFISQLIRDGDTLQVGFGMLPNAILRHLMEKKDLGIHTQLITDAMLPLFQQRVVTNRLKTLLPRRVVASLCMGSDKLYRFIDDNPFFDFRSSEFVSDPLVIARNDNLVSISSALEVDLTGQVCSDSLGYRFYSGIGDQVDFLRGAAMSKGGFSIVAMPSTAKNGEVSRIVSHLSEGAGVATTRGDVNFVVTEYGYAELQGKGIYQRVMELAQIAHPKFRAQLINEAKKHHYIFADQLPPLQEDLIYLQKYDWRFDLQDGRTIFIRPLYPADEFEYRNFFYSLKEETIYRRFFYKMRLFSHEIAQQQCAEVDYHDTMSLIGRVQNSGHSEVIAIGSYSRDQDGYAEVAFVVHDDYHGQGIASHMLGFLEQIARENHFIGFTATVMEDNQAMLNVFRRRYPHAELAVISSGEVHVIMPFDPPDARK
ncbi:bifunctional acetyl-CoA hydrolase/transferase family protein/GNAT family N-acetyltransferase [Desulfopila inferna]|uniref:bifunctional acetyl-CoA hydrolase/transferase family protein/GNAT family N-acetyltransferase n=1 Tax=Desulfopila inferna TaxID=468528 RepID=UPI001962317B|nr:bifunctional acetyl-CoA hydrolase/transferase family protein/GNAT family N-acetyltransferase [Desulfopila inferna]MBM9603467.1 GNAT family N-acetyltransferase [Desulfopila inferna]